MSAIKFSQLPILPVITTGTIVPAVYNGVNYQINLGAIKAYSIPAWSDVINKPAFNEVAFSGDYSVLVNQPRIPTAVSSLTNDLNFVSQSALTWSNISGKPALALVATSGLWADIAGKPTWFNTTATGYLYSDGSGTLSFQPAQGGGISTATVTALIANSLTNYTTTPFKLTSSTQVVSLDSSGTLHTPLLIPTTFTAVLVPVYGFAPGYNPPGPTGGDAWSYEVHFVVSQDGTVETQIDSPVWASNPGYKDGDSWTFHEADHGIPGYTFTLALSDIAYPGPAGWTANVLASEPPEYPSTVKSLGAVKLSANDKNWIFAPGGNLVFPDSSIQKSATNIIQSATTPTGSTSTLWYDTVGGRSYVYYDSGWVDASPMPAVDTTQLTNNGYSLSLDSAGIVNLPTFAGSPSIAIVQTASAGIGLNVNGTYFNFGQDGKLTVPGNIVPDSDNTRDLGSPSNRFRHLYVGPGSITIGESIITSAADGTVIIPGISSASGYQASSIIETNSQTETWLTTPTIIDQGYYEILSRISPTPFNYNPATYQASLDGSGNISNINISFEGSHWSEYISFRAQAGMWATTATNAIDSFNSADWISIPFQLTTIASSVLPPSYITDSFSSSTVAAMGQEVSIIAWNNNPADYYRTWSFNGGYEPGTSTITFPDGSQQTGASISIADLKAIITTCTNFTEFKNAILGL